jgi:hypothetical protein
MVRALALGSVQFSVVIGVAEGVNQASSAASIPTRKRRRRKMGWARRNATSRRVNASRSLSCCDQSNQEVGWSWQ